MCISLNLDQVQKTAKKDVKVNHKERVRKTVRSTERSSVRRRNDSSVRPATKRRTPLETPRNGK